MLGPKLAVAVDPSPKFQVAMWESRAPASEKLPEKVSDSWAAIRGAVLVKPLIAAWGATLVPMIVIESVPAMLPSSVARNVTT